MCEDQGVSGGGTKLGDHSIDTLPDLRGSLAVGDAVAPERPARALPSDVDRRPPLVGAAVLSISSSRSAAALAEAREAARLARARKRTRQNERQTVLS